MQPESTELIDAHVHPSLFDDPEQVYVTAAHSGITLVAMSVDAQDARRALTLAQRFSGPALMGVHPWFARSAQLPEEFWHCLEHPCLWGVGECGLDRESPLDLASQQKLLCALLEFACEHGLMVSLHVRKTHGELLRCLRAFRGRLRGMVHNFTFSEELARSYLDLNLYLSVGAHLLRRAPRLCRVLGYAGVEHLLLETDSDGVHSGPYRPQLLQEEYRVLSEVLSLPLPVVQEQLARNFRALAPRLS